MPTHNDETLLERIAELERKSAQDDGLTIWQAVEISKHLYRIAALEQALEFARAVAAADNTLHHAVDAAQAKVCELEAKLAQRVPDGWKLERMRHIANEWADMAINGLQHLRNLKDGIGSADLCAANMEKCLAHCREVNDAPGLYGQSAAPAEPEQNYQSEQHLEMVAQPPNAQHAPMASNVADAARDVAKCLNERDGQGLDLRHVAMLVHQ